MHKYELKTPIHKITFLEQMITWCTVRGSLCKTSLGEQICLISTWVQGQKQTTPFWKKTELRAEIFFLNSDCFIIPKYVFLEKPTMAC
jgi:hypothetical protein